MPPNEQPCWSCKKACGSRCPWAARFIPVEGWKAEKHVMECNGTVIESYRIIYCPLYEKSK